MNKRVIIIILAIIGLAGAGFLLIGNSDETITPESTASINTNTPSNEETAMQTGSSGQYIDYSATAISETDGEKVLFFHAPWCPQCRSIESGIESEGVPEGLSIIKVDYDTNQELRSKYGVTIQTTFVKVDNGGNFVSKYVAYDEPTFMSVKSNYLN